MILENRGEIYSETGNAIKASKGEFDTVVVEINNYGSIKAPGEEGKNSNGKRAGYAILIDPRVEAEVNLYDGSEVIGGIYSGAMPARNNELNLISEAGNENTLTSIITGSWDLSKKGEGTWILSGENQYSGTTSIDAGTLQLGNVKAIPQRSLTTVSGTGRLDLISRNVSGDFSIDELSIVEGGQLFVSADQPLKANKITLSANGLKNIGGIAVALNEKNDAPILIKGDEANSFDYQSGKLVVSAPSTDKPVGNWKIIDGYVENADELAENTFFVVGEDAYQFDGLGEDFAVDGGIAVYEGYLKKGSLELVIAAKSGTDLNCDLNPMADGCDKEPDKPVPPPIQLPSPDGAGGQRTAGRGW